MFLSLDIGIKLVYNEHTNINNIKRGLLKLAKFYLMGKKPKLDRDTINYIWDMLWRLNCVIKGTNADKRSRKNELERIMNLLQELADKECSDQDGVLV